MCGRAKAALRVATEDGAVPAVPRALDGDGVAFACIPVGAGQGGKLSDCHRQQPPTRNRWSLCQGRILPSSQIQGAQPINRVGEPETPLLVGL